jgi:catechol 2,3-dioxygenase-like lactoylglutathione lyase family enzyme
MPAVDHVGFTVTDLDRSIAFYRDVAGMELTLRKQSAGEWFGSLTRNPGAVIEIAMLELDGFTLQLIRYVERGGPALEVSHANVGSPHLSIWVDDVEAKRAQVEAIGGGDAGPLVLLGEDRALRSFYVLDPDGVPVEFVQRLGVPG